MRRAEEGEISEATCVAPRIARSAPRDRLYFDELSFEAIREIYHKEKALGIVISMGGQTPNNLAMRFHQAGMKVFGTSAP